jgi:hypothetical protein
MDLKRLRLMGAGRAARYCVAWMSREATRVHVMKDKEPNWAIPALASRSCLTKMAPCGRALKRLPLGIVVANDDWKCP